MRQFEANRAFEAAANNGVLVAPGVAGLEALCSSFGSILTKHANMQDACEEVGLDPTANVFKTDFENLMIYLGWARKF